MKETIKFTVEGMTCQHCVMSVMDALSNIKGVKEVDVDLTTKQAVLTVKKAVDKELIASVVAEAGYKVVWGE
ncbi:MAG: heavy-metal-associated domain-containing protein [Spirochaetales bacterium]|nr:heavy-metal-associated domain-containing protein [Spirochaetales bacterium]